MLKKISEALKAFPAALAGLSVPLIGKMESLTRGLFSHFPEKMRRPMLFALGGLAALFLILIISAIALRPRGSRESASVDMSGGPRINIPPEELFLPTQPDFVPEFLLEREPRGSWSIEDIRPYWRNPAYSTVWQDEIQSAVDRLMETVP